jgi:transcriptional regulator with XRE-family HTH domain
MENKHLFGQRLRAARVEKGLTRERFAHAVGVDPPCAYWWESGRNYPRTEKLIEISRYLGVSIDWLCGLECGQ